MEKINFINNQQPAINDTNLNKLQDNVEDAIDVVQTDTNTKLNKTSVKTTKTTSGTDTYSCNYINDKVEKSLIDLTSTNTTTLSTGGTQIAFNSVRTQIGTNLTYSSNGVLIGSGISKVRVIISQGIQNSGSGVDQKRLELQLNNTTIRTSYNATSSSQYSSTTIDIFAILSVTQNDKLTVKGAYGSISSNALSGNYATFIVEEIE